jgi:MFS family permease
MPHTEAARIEADLSAAEELPHGRPPGKSLALLVLALCFLMNMLARGVAETYAVFLLPLTDAFGWDRGQLTSAYALYMLVGGLAAPAAGMLIDRVGPGVVYAFGIACLGCGQLLASQVTELWQYYLGIGLLSGLGTAAMGMVTASTLLSRWFRDRLGTAMGFGYAALGTGVLVIVPLAQVLIERIGWRTTYLALGCSLLALLPLLLVIPWKRIIAGNPDHATARADDVARQGSWTLARALRDPSFWGLFNVFMFTSMAVFSIVPQAVAYLVACGFDPLAAAGAFGVNGFLSVIGIIATGMLADRFRRRLIATVTYLFTLTGIIVLMVMPHLPSPWLLFAFVLFFGIGQGARGPVVAALAARLYPGGGLGGIYGAITFGLGIGAGAGSWAAGHLYDATGGYQAGFVLAAAAVLAGIAQFWVFPALNDGRRHPPRAG